MTDQTTIAALTQAVGRYFDLHHTYDTSLFDAVFRPTAQLHGFRDGRMVVWAAAAYREMMGTRPSPLSQGAAREEAILAIDFASPDQAMVKVRLRVGAITYVDHLCWHREDGAWRVTAKAFHVERVD